MSGDVLPHVNFFPYLPIRAAVVVGPYRVVPISDFGGPWRDDEFERAARAFMGSFVRTDGTALPGGALVTDVATGCDGAVLGHDEGTAVQRAIEFAALDTNPPPGPGHNGWMAVTSDNTELHSWPLDVRGGAVSLQSGLVVRTVNSGPRVADGFVVPAPEELHVPLGAISLDEEIPDAIYRRVLAGEQAGGDHEGRRLERAIGWLAKAWRNTPSVGWDDRVVLLKTGFEALTGHSRTHEAADALADLYARVVGGDEVGRSLLWSSDDRPTREYFARDGKTYLCTDQQHWFRSFGDLRNSIIHGDVVTGSFGYDLDGSAYNGHFFDTAERVLRESVKVALSEMEGRALYEPLVVRRMTDRLRVEFAED